MAIISRRPFMSKGTRVASPFTHFVIGTSTIWAILWVLNEDRPDVQMLPPPPCPAPPAPPGTLDVVGSMEMPYRRAGEVMHLMQKKEAKPTSQ